MAELDLDTLCDLLDDDDEEQFLEQQQCFQRQKVKSLILNLVVSDWQ